MPIYEYRCQECNERFSKLVRSLANPPEILCPKCGSEGARKLASTFAAHGLESQVDNYSGGDESDLAVDKPSFGRKELAEARKLRDDAS
jgi:putative FmdB family regulatory protein